jgi:hypothetical protein
MDLLKIIPDNKDEIRIVKEQEKEYKFIGSLILKPGHSIFKYNELTWEITLPEINRQIAVKLDGKPIKKQKILFEPNCIYIAALNKRNAERKIKKLLRLLK